MTFLILQELGKLRWNMITHIGEWQRGSEKDVSFRSQWRKVSLVVMSNSCLGSWTETPGEHERVRDEGHRLQQERLWLGTKWKKFFAMREVKHGIDYPESLWGLHPWRYAKLSLTRPWTTWSDLELVADFGVDAAVNRGRRCLNFRGHFQLKFSCHYMFLCVSWE